MHHLTTIYYPQRVFDDRRSEANTIAHLGPWRWTWAINKFALELDDVAIIFLLAVWVFLWASHGIIWSRPPKGHYLYFVAPQLQEGPLLNKRGPQKSITRKINDRMTELGKSIIVFWGSQSGKSERLANDFVRECMTRFNLSAMAANLDLFDYDQLGELSEGRLVGFIVATYGEGDPTDNASALYEYLRAIERNRDRPLPRLNYFCFGLGNSKYQFYNRFVDFVDETLTSCGARRIAPVGKIDEASRSNDAWRSWSDGMKTILGERFGCNECIDRQLPEFDLVALSDRTAVSNVAMTPTATRCNQEQQLVQITRSFQLSGSGFSKSVQEPVRTYLHLELGTRIGSPAIRYDTGDHIAIWPINPNEEVDLLASLFGWGKNTLKATVDIKPCTPGVDEATAIPVPTPTTREALIRNQLDICGPVGPDVLELLSAYSANDNAKAYLDRCRFDPESRSDIFSQHLTCGQLMRRAAPGAIWSEDVFSALLSLMPKIRPRYYSIASSALVEPDSIAITAGLVETHAGRAEGPFVGLTTGYLSAMHGQMNQINNTSRLRHFDNPDGPRSILSDYKLFAQVRKSKFKPPADIKTPMVMIATGSGIAPFRGFVRERMALAARRVESCGKMILVYGCRSDADCLYLDLWSKAEDMGILETHFAFSARPVDGKKYYVQHKLLEEGETMKQLIEQGNGSVYICGSADMASAVKANLGMLLSDSGAIQQLKESARLQEDVWA